MSPPLLAIESAPHHLRRFARRLAVAFAVADGLTAFLLLIAVFVGLPARWFPVDALAGVLVALFLISAYALLFRPVQMAALVRIVALVQLVMGLGAFAIGTWTAFYLSGIYGPVGRGGALILGLVTAIVLPYLVLLPGAKLLWIGPRATASPAGRSAALDLHAATADSA